MREPTFLVLLRHRWSLLNFVLYRNANRACGPLGSELTLVAVSDAFSFECFEPLSPACKP